MTLLPRANLYPRSSLSPKEILPIVEAPGGPGVNVDLSIEFWRYGPVEIIVTDGSRIPQDYGESEILVESFGFERP